MAFLVQLLLPRSKTAVSALFQDVRTELTDKFGGVTVYSRAPAEGLWTSDSEEVVQDQLVLFEVMVNKLEQSWWRDYCRELERRFQQAEIVIRAHEVDRL